MLNRITSNKLILVLILICLILFRYDFTFNLLPYKVKADDTLWSILEEKVYHNSPITGLSLQYVSINNSTLDLDRVMKNNQGQGGYKVSILFNKLTITGPNNKSIISNALILPSSALINHAIQVLTYNTVIIAFAVFLYANFKDNKFRFNLSLLKSTFSIPILLFFATLLIIFIMLIMFILYMLLIIYPNSSDNKVRILINTDTNRPIKDLRIIDNFSTMSSTPKNQNNIEK